MQRRSVGKARTALWSVAVGWLLNPLVVNISTRGNAESIIGALVVATLYFIELERDVIAGLL